MEQRVLDALSQIVANNRWSAKKIAETINYNGSKSQAVVTPYQVGQTLKTLVAQGYVNMSKDGAEPAVFWLKDKGRALVQ